MKTFTINDNIQVRCETKERPSGFTHKATLVYNGFDRGEVKCLYYNRTWESYEYQSVLYKLAERSKALSSEEKKLLVDFAKEGDKNDDGGLGTIGAIMALGDIMGGNQAESNDWKERMMRAGLEGRGLIMPDDWDTLSDDEKTRRLDGVRDILLNK